jgi:hypothetical protein
MIMLLLYIYVEAGNMEEIFGGLNIRWMCKITLTAIIANFTIKCIPRDRGRQRYLKM